jgi:lipopolysaccharide export system protein LptA
MIARFLAALLLLAVLAAAPARAQPIDLSSGGPVEVTARDGFEWHENDQTVIANGDARAVRSNVTVLADQLVAHYRKKASATQPAPTPVQPTAVAAGDADNGSNEIYRLDAIGHVRIVTPTDEAVGDKAVYDIDQAVMVMTGAHLRLTSPQYVMTARDNLEYWAQLHMAVGRGNALVVATDGRRLSADVLVGHISQGAAPGKPDAPHPAAASADASGKLERVEAFGNVEVRTATDTVRGERGVYVPDTGMARVLGNVRVVHGQNVITGAAADVNMKTGIAHVIANPARRVQGLIVPNDTSAPGGTGPAAPKGPSR